VLTPLPFEGVESMLFIETSKLGRHGACHDYG